MRPASLIRLRLATPHLPPYSVGKLFTRLAKLIVVFAAVQILGGHWLALQSVAWIGMLASYSHGQTLVVAIEKTFDGAHPCGLCKVVKTGRTEEQKQQVVKMIVKLDAVLGAVIQMPEPHRAEWRYFDSVPDMAARSLAPPTPPPQVA